VGGPEDRKKEDLIYCQYSFSRMYSPVAEWDRVRPGRLGPKRNIVFICYSLAVLSPSDWRKVEEVEGMNWGGRDFIQSEVSARTAHTQRGRSGEEARRRRSRGQNFMVHASARACGVGCQCSMTHWYHQHITMK
jgi:hypothetical protein